jgi:hypothetical protein
LEAHKLGVEKIPPSAFWSSSMRYIDFLFKIALDSDPNDSGALVAYSQFLALSGSRDSAVKECFLLLRALSANHKDNMAAVSLLRMLEELGMKKEFTLLSLWLKRLG